MNTSDIVHCTKGEEYTWRVTGAMQNFLDGVAKFIRKDFPAVWRRVSSVNECVTFAMGTKRSFEFARLGGQAWSRKTRWQASRGTRRCDETRSRKQTRTHILDVDRSPCRLAPYIFFGVGLTVSTTDWTSPDPDVHIVFSLEVRTSELDREVLRTCFEQQSGLALSR